jgi:hypothetical protein
MTGKSIVGHIAYQASVLENHEPGVGSARHHRGGVACARTRI